MAIKKILPVHPGDILREEFMLLREPSSNALGRAIGMMPARADEIANAKGGITADTASRAGRYLGSTAGVLINLQMRFDLETARAT